jgi:hypothetical protein
MKSLLLTKEDLSLLEQVISIPLEAFGLAELLEKTGFKEERIQKLFTPIQDYLKDLKEESIEIEISTEDLNDLIKIYDVSCEIIDPIEMPTITGYSWKDSQQLLIKLKEALI